MRLKEDVSHAKKMVGETYDIRWTMLFCDFWSLLDDDLKEKYPIRGLDLRDAYSSKYQDARVCIKGATVTLRYQSTVYRAMSMIAEEEGDYRMATAFMMCVKTCVPVWSGDSRDTQIVKIYHKEIDSKIADLQSMMPKQKKDILKG